MKFDISDILKCAFKFKLFSDLGRVDIGLHLYFVCNDIKFCGYGPGSSILNLMDLDLCQRKPFLLEITNLQF